MRTTKFATVWAVIFTVLVGCLLFQYQSQIDLRQQNEDLRRQIAKLLSEQEKISNQVAQAQKSGSLSSEQLRELLKLRGEVGRLRRRQLELEQAGASAKSSPVSGPIDSNSRSGIPAPFQLQMVLDQASEDSETLTNSNSQSGTETFYVQKTPLLDHTAINSVAVVKDSATGSPQIEVEFSELGKELFAAVTRENINKRLAIVLGGQLYSAPVIRSEITGGKALVSGNFTDAEARDLATKINDAVTPK